VFFRILETPLFDILVLLLLVRIFFPQIFGVRRKESSRENIFIRSKSKRKSSDQKKDEGEYIEYEEVK